MVAKALAAALNRAVLPDGKLGNVQRVGAFLLAGSEVHQLVRAR